MRSTNRRRYESLANILALCEAHRDQLESTPLGTQLINQLGAVTTRVAGLFKTQSDGRNSAHDATGKRRTAARLVRRHATDLVRHAKALGAVSGPAIQLPPLREGSHQQLIADARSAVDTAQPLAGVFKANKLTVLDDLPPQIAALDAAMKDQSAGRETHVGASAVVTEALNEGAQVAAALEPIFRSVVNGDPELIAKWNNARRIGPARPRKDAGPVAATGPAPEKPATDKVA